VDSFEIDPDVYRRGPWLSTWVMVQPVEDYGEGFAGSLLEQFIMAVAHGPRS
jgi:hypothetical protein